MPTFSPDGDRAYDLLRRMGPSRLGGSAREREAARTLAAEIQGFGPEPAEETFPVRTCSDLTARLSVLAPFEAQVACQAIGLSGQTGEAGIEAPLVFAESGGPKYVAGCRDQIPLIYGRLNAIKYEALATAGVAGFVCIAKPGLRAMYNMLEAKWIARWGARPGAFISFEDGLRLVREGASRVRLTVRQREFEGESRNLVVEIPGTRQPEEVIVVGAHMDSHRDMDGAHDDGAGCVVAMELCRRFAAHPAARTLRFVWFGSEELGCRGSEAYVARHADELEAIVFMVNLDLGGGILGQDAVDVMGPPELRAFFDLLNRERGLGLEIQEKVYGGDNGPFVGRGIPAAAIYRAAGTAYYIHSPDDGLDLVDGRHLTLLAEQAAEFVDRIANAHRFPFERQVSDRIQKEYRRVLIEYLGLTPSEADAVTSGQGEG
jgi:aminopeptidase YwaD